MAAKSVISLFLASNRPANLLGLFDNIRETVEDPTRVEVLIKIDEGDEACRGVIISSIPNYPFAIKFIETPKRGGYFDLWIAYNDLLKVMNPEAYYLAVVNDELRYVTKSWDVVLDQLQGSFADDIFRIRISKFKLTNYFDIWQCAFAPDAYAFHTRKWIQLGGDWNLGGTPDAFQQCVAFYLARSNYPYRFQLNRDIPCMQIQLKDEQPYLGLTHQEYRHRTRNGWKYWYALQSYKTQLICSRRAHVLRAHIEYGSEISIEDFASKKMLIIRRADGTVVTKLSYGISWLKTNIRNWSRYPLKQYHCGGTWGEFKGYYDSNYWQPIVGYYKINMPILREKLKSPFRKIPYLETAYRKLKLLKSAVK